MSQLPADQMERLLAEEPFVRELARHLAAVDADDVVQQTWLRALQSRSGPVERPRHWLARVVRNVAANLRRSDRRRDERELADAVAGVAPSSAELMEREERRRQLVAAVDRLPPVLRAVVLLRFFEGLPPRAIAARLAVPAATVSTQLQRALAQLRQQLDDEHGGDRRAWLLPLMTFARPPRVAPLPKWLPSAPAWMTGAIAMITKTKIVGVAVVLAVASAWALWPSDGEPSLGPRQTSTGGASVAARAELDQAGKTDAGLGASQREAVTVPAVATTGSLVVHVSYGDDHAPAADLTVSVYRDDCDARIDGRRVRTDASGDARLEGLMPATYIATSVSRQGGKRVQITAGETTELGFELKVGLTLTGIVVDSTGVPVPGALVEVEPLTADDPEVLATTGPDGRFLIRAANTLCLVGARAAGFTASSMRFFSSRDGNSAEVRLELGKAGGVVQGLVIDHLGQPVTDALVVVGSETINKASTGDGSPPGPALTRSDAQGRFLAVGVPAGNQPVVARATGFGPWRGRCEVVANLTAPLRIVLYPGTSVHGIVRNAQGAVVAGAALEVGSWSSLAHYLTHSADDGSFELTALPEGEITIEAEHDAFGKATQRVSTIAGRTVECVLQLMRGIVLAGRVVDENDKPVAGALLMFVRDGLPTWSTVAWTDAKGHFEAANCPEHGRVLMSASAEGIESVPLHEIDLKAGELVVHVHHATPETSYLTGQVVAPDDKPAVNVMASAFLRGDKNRGQDRSAIYSTDQDGRFAIGPLVPGPWEIHLTSSDYPNLTAEPRELAAGATVDVGVLRLALGGTAIFEVSGGGDLAGTTFYVVDEFERYVRNVPAALGRIRTNALAAGDYRLEVTGKGTAGQMVPFSIRAREETSGTVQLQPGTAQRFECVLPTGFEAKDMVTLRVRRATTVVQRTWASVTRQPIAAELWLAPGTYEVTATVGALTGTATFTVGAEPRDPVTVTLR